MIFLYNISVFLYALSIRVAALCGNAKAKKWIDGRKNLFEEILQKINKSEKHIWFHCASLGEFEQGRPVIEKLSEAKSTFGGRKIILTFFSPSGYEIRKNYSGADYVFYLPLDTKANAQKFISLINPEKVFFVKYEYWFHYLNELRKKKIDIFIISAIFRKEQIFFKWYGGFFRRILKMVSHFFLQKESSGEFLQSIGINNFEVTGDTRFDRVVELSENAKSFPLIEKFKSENKVLIAGSTWHADEKIIAELISHSSEISSHIKFIIAPHEVSDQEINWLTFLLHEKAGAKKVLCYSQANESTITSADVLIIDSIGMLSSLYQYGDVAFVGGGFSKGIHNILEPAAFGMPVFFGPNYEKFNEAKELIAKGVAFSFSSSNYFQKKISEFFSDDAMRNKTSLIAKEYVQNNKGATEKITGYLLNN